MAEVDVTLNELVGRDADLARLFEAEIRTAAALVPASPTGRLGCRILAWGRHLDLGSRQAVTVLFSLPGWVKALSIPMAPLPGEIRDATGRALRAKLLREPVH